MSNAPSVLKEQRFVESFEVDKKGRLQPHMLFSYFLNCAWNHASATGFGYQELSSRNLMWVLSKLQLSITRMPEWRERILLETWGKGTERFYALRDFAVSLSEGQKIVSATSAWMILDKDNYRPQRIEQILASYPWEARQSEMERSLKKLPECPNSVDRAHYRVLFTDIDVNNHVNAAKYLQWIVDSYPREALEEKQLKYLEMSFAAEATIDDDVIVFRESLPDKEVNTVRLAKNQKELCRAVVQWNVPLRDL